MAASDLIDRLKAKVPHPPTAEATASIPVQQKHLAADDVDLGFLLADILTRLQALEGGTPAETATYTDATPA
ncbi:hypothetical protein [Hymenobacter properus]|uniref:Uncharacterized protein n=1 Tax=Hymenobacter properus TaxID=2791026 RepID=A0A931BJY9_9BACT|nr:hypothetical protein [Hymenobacter properus]MBF9140860.1 hypothetical protein [Hymenobacter properus]MBR7719669.1 hypothetical protein [Microvirga sp. SRT04]